MTEEPLSVDKVDIRRAPGFDTGGFPMEDLSNGITVVHGPNASGKTTIARATQWLLWPDHADDRASIVGRLSLNGEGWRVELDRGRARYQLNGQDANGPNLPPADQRDRYHLSLHDLLQHETRDESFAQAILRESAGGYDLAAAGDDLGFDASPSTRGKAVVKEADTAIDEWRAARETVRELRDDQDRLAGLEANLAEARQAQQRVTLLEQAIAYAEAQNERENAEAELEQYAAELERIDGDEAATVEDLEERIEEWQSRKQEASADLDAARAALEDADLPDDGVAMGFLERVKQRRDTLEEHERTIDQLADEFANARERRRKFRDNLPLDLEEEALVELDPGTWKDVSEFGRTSQRVQGDRAARDAVEAWLARDCELEAELSNLQHASRELERWLAAPTDYAVDIGNRAFTLAVVSAALLAISGILLGMLVNPLLFSLLLLAGGLLWYGNRVRTEARTDASARDAHRDSVEQLEVDGPASWSADDVRARLLELYDGIAAHQLDEKREERRDALVENFSELDRREEVLKEQREALREELGAAPDRTDLELTVIVYGILEWQEAHSEVVGLEEELGTAEEHLETTRTQLESDLEPYGYDEITDSAVGLQYIRNLEERATTFDQAQQDLERAKATIEEADEMLEDLTADRATVFTACGLDSDEDDRLRELCEQVNDYRKVVKRVEQKKLLQSKAEQELETLPEFDPELTDRSVADLREAKRDAADTAADYDDIHERITEIETRIKDAKHDTTVEDALTEKQRSLDALAGQLEADSASMVGDVLLDHVGSATSEASRPDVFSHAREVLARITRGRYRLDIDEEAHSFRPIDTVRERGFALDELSSATRLQVLMAVRIAFVEQQEHNVRLPLILDETLANTDDGKAEVIIDAMIELARRGRQVLYFTAQGDEVAKWHSALDECEDVDHVTIDLADVRDLDNHVDVPDLAEIPTQRPSPPSPEGHDHDSYSDAIDVPPFNPRLGAGNTHLWYLVDDVTLLHRLLELGVEWWGQFETLLTQTGGDVITDDPASLADVKQNGAAVQEYIRCWRKGRGKRVDREALEQSGAVSGNFIAEVTALAEDVNGEATEIIDALRAGEVTRFHSGKTDDLEAFFEDNGYIVPVAPLEPAQIRLRVMDSMVTSGLNREDATDRADDLLARLTA